MRILAIDDESRALKRIERLSRAILSDQIEAFHAAGSLREGNAYLEEGKVDLLLLDLNLNGKDGFEILQTVAACPFHTIIVSAYHDKALKAFEHDVLDFVPKPVEEARLKAAFERYSHKRDPIPRLLAIKAAGRTEFIAIDDVLYFSGANDFT